MDRRRRRLTGFAVGLVLLASVLARPVIAPGEIRYGIEIVGYPSDPGPVPSDVLREVHTAASDLAERRQQDFGYPWLDRGAERVVLRPVTAAGRERAQRLIATFAERGAAVTTEPTDRSSADLADISERLTMGGTLLAIDHDEEHNRLILHVTRMDDEQLRRLAETYDPAAIAVLIDPFSPYRGSGPA